MALVQSEAQTAYSWIQTRTADSICNAENCFVHNGYNSEFDICGDCEYSDWQAEGQEVILPVWKLKMR